MSKASDHPAVPGTTSASGRKADTSSAAEKAAIRARRNAAGKLRKAEQALKGSPSETFPVNSPRRDVLHAAKTRAGSGLAAKGPRKPTKGQTGQSGDGEAVRTAAKPGTVAGSHRRSRDPFLTSPADPGRGNTGVDSAKKDSFTGFSFSNASALGKPSEYFHRLALDALAVSVRGEWADPEASERFFDLRSAAEEAALTDEGVFFEAPDGTELRVFPHAGRGGYRVLLRGADSPEIKGSPNKSRPPLLIRFGARWCVENSVADLERWVLDFLALIRFEPLALDLSEVHVRCDVPHPFVHADLDLIRGLALRNGSYTTHVAKGLLSGITNLGGQKDLIYSLYDKQLQQTKGNDPYWRGLWRSYGITSGLPVWRVEARFKREKLRRAGVEELRHLSPKAVRELWHWFATKHFVLVADPSKRLSRAGFSEKWRPIAECGSHFQPAAPQFNVEVDESQLAKQAIGLLAKLFLLSDLNDFSGRARRVVDDIVIQGRRRGWEILTADDRLLRHYIEMTVGDCGEEPTDVERGKLVDWLVREIREKMKRHPGRKPFSARPTEGGES